MNKKIIPIFFAVDNNYAPFLSVVIESIKANSSMDYIYKLHVLNNDITPEFKHLIEKYNSDNIEIEFFSITKRLEELKTTLKLRDYYTNAIYYRLFIPELFPQYSKVLYLDADIVILDDISKLYEEDVDNYCLGVVRDDVISLCDEFKDYTIKALGVANEKYFNSGILVMNLDKMREYHILNKFLYMIPNFQFVVAPDQDFLNILCKDKVKYLNINWNFAPLNNAQFNDDVKLIHFKLTAKPWHYDNIQGGDKFWLYANKTEFKYYLQNLLLNYSSECKEKDNQVEENLKKLCIKEIERISEYQKVNGDFQTIIEGIINE